MKKIVCIFYAVSMFLAGCSKDNNQNLKTIPNIKFNLNKIACLFSESYIEKDLEKELENEISESFLTNSENNKEKQSEFVDKIINKRNDHEYITPRFSKILSNSLLKYDSIFDKNSDILHIKKEEMQNYIYLKLLESSSFFKPVFNLYDPNNLKNNHQFNVYIYPSNNGKYISKITSFNDNIMLRFNYGNTEEDLLSILKEICNRLYYEIKESNKEIIEKYLFEHKSSYAKSTYFMLDDILANTIILWSKSKLNPPKLKEKSQINENNLKNNNKANDFKIDNLYKSLLPDISKYLEDKKSIDFKLLDTIVNLVQKYNPKIKDDINLMLTRISLIIENGIDSIVCEKSLYSNFKIDYITNKASKFTTVFIGKDLGNRALSKVISKIPNSANDFLFITNSINEKQLFIIIKTNDINKITKAIEMVKKLKSIPNNDFKEDL